MMHSIFIFTLIISLILSSTTTAIHTHHKHHHHQLQHNAHHQKSHHASKSHHQIHHFVARQTADEIKPCDASQQACIDNVDGLCSNTNCQRCEKTLNAYRCQPKTRCYTTTEQLAPVGYPDGYKRPEKFAVGGNGNCAVTADCSFHSQLCSLMAQDDMGGYDDGKCQSFIKDPRFTAQECSCCVQTANDLTVREGRYTPKITCSGPNIDKIPTTFTSTCPNTAAAKPPIAPVPSAPIVPLTPLIPQAPAMTTTKAPVKAGSVGSTATYVCVSVVTVVVTAATAVMLA